MILDYEDICAIRAVWVVKDEISKQGRREVSQLSPIQLTGATAGVQHRGEAEGHRPQAEKSGTSQGRREMQRVISHIEIRNHWEV